ncbi:MAG: hypothetical protein QOH31_1134 [Verrucomicrobiota bacterium]|jgi:hypothetical protein
MIAQLDCKRLAYLERIIVTRMFRFFQPRSNAKTRQLEISMVYRAAVTSVAVIASIPYNG